MKLPWGWSCLPSTMCYVTGIPVWKMRSVQDLSDQTLQPHVVGDENSPRLHADGWALLKAGVLTAPAYLCWFCSLLNLWKSPAKLDRELIFLVGQMRDTPVHLIAAMADFFRIAMHTSDFSWSCSVHYCVPEGHFSSQFYLYPKWTV